MHNIDLETLIGETEMSSKRVTMRMVLVMLLVGAFLLAVVPAMAAPDSPQGIQNEAPGPGGRGNGGQRGGNNSSNGTQQNSYSTGAQQNGYGTGYVDADGDGVCDNCTGTQQNSYGNGAGMGYGYVDADGDGICDNCGTNFVDADGDGVCDNCTGTNYVDADGDGVCDNMVTPNAWSGSRTGGQGRGRSR
jgi:rubredoxin